MSTFQREEVKVEFKLLESCIKKFSNEFLHRQIGGFRSKKKKNEDINGLQLRKKKFNFLKLFPLLDKIFYQFGVTQLNTVKNTTFQPF